MSAKGNSVEFDVWQSDSVDEHIISTQDSVLSRQEILSCEEGDDIVLVDAVAHGLGEWKAGKSPPADALTGLPIQG